MSKPFIICLMGPTAAGKTDLAVQLVQHFPCEIISVDSAMVYRGLDIGTAKPNAALLEIAPHHLLDIRDPAEPYSAGEFQKDALELIQRIIEKNRIPLLVGGTMLYFHTLQKGLASLPTASSEIRLKLSQEAETAGWQALHERLQKIDPIAAQRIHPNDPQRIQRALEVFLCTGKTLTQWFDEQNNSALPFSIINIALIPQDRNLLHLKIAKRFQNMLEQGFIAEVTKLYERGDLTVDLPAIRAVGYRQAWDYLARKLNYIEMQEKAVIATRQLAKRQLTWLKSWDDLHCIASEDPAVFDRICGLIREKVTSR